MAKKYKLIFKIPLNRDEYWLHYNPKSDRYSINYKIDRGMKGKDSDLGLPIVYLEDENVIKKIKKYLDLIEFSL